MLQLLVAEKLKGEQMMIGLCVHIENVLLP